LRHIVEISQKRIGKIASLYMNLYVLREMYLYGQKNLSSC